MKKYLDKYFNWLDVKNEGIRRIILILHLIAFLFMWFILAGDMNEGEAFMLSLFTPILTTVIIKCIVWVKQGFVNEDGTP